MRAFLALDIPEDVADALEALQRAAPVGRPVPRENLHLTLAFIADLPEALEEAVHDALSTLHATPVIVEFAGLVGLGPAEQGVLAIEVQATPALSDLQSRAEGRLRRAGLDLPRRRFRPHVTLTRMARPPKGDQQARLAAFMARGAPPLPGFTADAMVLYESELGPGGARHMSLARYPLRPAP